MDEDARMPWPELPAPLRELDLDGLVGRTVASARQLVDRAGGEVRTTTLHGYLTADFRPSRVTLVVEDGRVIAVHGFG